MYLLVEEALASTLSGQCVHLHFAGPFPLQIAPDL